MKIIFPEHLPSWSTVVNFGRSLTSCPQQIRHDLSCPSWNWLPGTSWRAEPTQYTTHRSSTCWLLQFSASYFCVYFLCATSHGWQEFNSHVFNRAGIYGLPAVTATFPTNIMPRQLLMGMRWALIWCHRHTTHPSLLGWPHTSLSHSWKQSLVITTTTTTITSSLHPPSKARSELPISQNRSQEIGKTSSMGHPRKGY